MEYPSICEEYVEAKDVCIFCFVCGTFFVYLQGFFGGFLTQGIVSLICTGFLMGKKESHRKEFVGWIVIGSCHRILGKIRVQTIIKHHPVIISSGFFGS